MFAYTVSAHPLIPLEVVDYMEENPQATDADIENFFTENFGSVSEYYGIPEGEESFTLKELYTPPEDFMVLTEVEQNQLLEEQEKARKNLRIFLDLQSGVMTPFEHFVTFVKLGFKHILSGIDHILFVIAMVLVLPPWRKILALISTFTVAHSLTLLLAGSGILTLSSRIVEPIIAFSIGFVAIATVFGKHSENEKMRTALLTVFFFGLFHGLGFAGLLTDFQIPQGKLLTSVLYFNIGVELGQLFILVLILPVLYLLSKTPFFPIFIRISAITLAVVSMAWVVERVAL